MAKSIHSAASKYFNSKVLIFLIEYSIINMEVAT